MAPHAPHALAATHTCITTRTNTCLVRTWTGLTRSRTPWPTVSSNAVATAGPSGTTHKAFPVSF